MTFAEKTADLYSMINNGQLLESLDKKLSLKKEESSLLDESQIRE
jgi:hypothetical protein